MPSPAGSRKLTLSVSPQIAERLDEMANRKGITVSELLRRAITTQSVIDKAIEEYGDLVIVRRDTREPVHQLDALA